MPTVHLVIQAASDYLASGDDVHIFERRVEDAIGHVSTFAQKMTLIDEAKSHLQRRETTEAHRMQVLLAFLDRQRQIIRGELR